VSAQSPELAAGSGYLGIDYAWSVGSVALCALPATVLLGRRFAGGPKPPDAAPRPTRRRPTSAVCLLAAAAVAAVVVESSVADWSGMLLRHELGASHAVAALGYPLFQCGLLSGRLITDRIRAACGSRRVIAGGGLATIAGFATVAAAATPALALFALYAVGAAIGPVLPTTFSAAGTVGRRSDGSAIAQVGAVGYTGLLAGPVMVATVTSVGTLRGGLAAVVVAFAAASGAGAAARPPAATTQPVPPRHQT
jgi:sugar phosphate permease